VSLIPKTLFAQQKKFKSEIQPKLTINQRAIIRRISEMFASEKLSIRSTAISVAVSQRIKSMSTAKQTYAFAHSNFSVIKLRPQISIFHNLKKSSTKSFHAFQSK
jgi:hypothetical protein